MPDRIYPMKKRNDEDLPADEEPEEHIVLCPSEKEQIAITVRRREVASLLAQSRTESEIAKTLGVNQSTISRDVRALKEEAGSFLQDLAKSDLVFLYQQSIRGVEEVKRRLWDIIGSGGEEYSSKDKLLAFRLIMIAEETKFRLLNKGPVLLSYESLEEKVKSLERMAKDIA